MLNFLKYTLIKNSLSTTLKSRVRLAIWGGEGRLVEGLEMSFKASKTDGVSINYIETKVCNMVCYFTFKVQLIIIWLKLPLSCLFTNNSPTLFKV